MRNKAFEYYSPIHLGKLRRVLADIYTAFGDVSENLYLVGGLVPDLLVENKLSYLREYLDVMDAFKAIYKHFSDESSSGTKDVANILIKRYGLERSFANKEIIVPIRNLKSK